MIKGQKKKSLENQLLRGRQVRGSSVRDRRDDMETQDGTIKSAGSERPREKSYNRSNNL